MARKTARKVFIKIYCFSLQEKNGEGAWSYSVKGSRVRSPKFLDVLRRRCSAVHLRLLMKICVLLVGRRGEGEREGGRLGGGGERVGGRVGERERDGKYRRLRFSKESTDLRWLLLRAAHIEGLVIVVVLFLGTEGVWVWWVGVVGVHGGR